MQTDPDHHDTQGDDLDDEKLLDDIEQYRPVQHFEAGDKLVLVPDHRPQDLTVNKYHPDDAINLLLHYIDVFDPASLAVTHDGGNGRITYKRGQTLIVWPFLWDPDVPARREQRINTPRTSAGNRVDDA